MCCASDNHNYMCLFLFFVRTQRADHFIHINSTRNSTETKNIQRQKTYFKQLVTTKYLCVKKNRKINKYIKRTTHTKILILDINDSQFLVMKLQLILLPCKNLLQSGGVLQNKFENTEQQGRLPIFTHANISPGYQEKLVFHLPVIRLHLQNTK